MNAKAVLFVDRGNFSHGFSATVRIDARILAVLAVIGNGFRACEIFGLVEIKIPLYGIGNELE